MWVVYWILNNGGYKWFFIKFCVDEVDRKSFGINCIIGMRDIVVYMIFF